MLSKVKFFQGVIMVGLLLSAGTTFAANYYVDYVGGVDTNKGTNTTTAWKHCPGDPTATGVPSTTTLAAGDTVHFKGGVKYVLNAPYINAAGAPGIVLKWSGAAGKPITYMSDSSWGTNRAIFTDNAGKNVINAFGSSGSINFVSLLNLEIGPVGGSLTLPADTGSAVPPNPGGGIVAGAAMNSVVISNCYFHELGYWYNQKPMNAISISGGGIVCRGANNLVITNCEFTKTAVGCELQIPDLMTNVVVAGCDFHNYMVWAIDLAITGNGAVMDSLYFHDNVFHDTDANYGSYTWTGYGTGPHQDGIFFRGDAVATFTNGSNINFYNNRFYSTYTGDGGTACIYLTGGTSANIYNNTFERVPVQNGIISITDPVLGVKFLDRIYNNTFYVEYTHALYIGGKQGIGGQYWPTNGTQLQIDVQNNIFYDIVTNSGNNFLFALDMTNSAAASNFYFDYNNWFSFNRDKTFGFWANIGGELSLVKSAYGSAMSAYGWETHGATNNPVFVDGTHGTAGYLNNYHPATNSPCINSGANLSSINLLGLSKDKDGQPRPSSGAWAKGAYQTTAGGIVSVAPPKPASGLHTTN